MLYDELLNIGDCENSLYLGCRHCEVCKVELHTRFFYLVEEESKLQEIIDDTWYYNRYFDDDDEEVHRRLKPIGEKILSIRKEREKIDEIWKNIEG